LTTNLAWLLSPQFTAKLSFFGVRVSELPDVSVLNSCNWICFLLEHSIPGTSLTSNSSFDRLYFRSAGSLSGSFSFFAFESGSHYVALSGFKLTVLLPQTPK
jgi:hypothetical protein